ncbi:MAG: RDD family protein [Terriglobia bacterium]
MEDRFDEKLRIDTPEQVALEFPLAGIGSRFLALAIDTLLTGIAVAALFALLVLALYFTRAHAVPRTWLGAFFVISAFVVFFGYFAIFEALWNGQTPGKRAADVRVIMDSGRPITAFAAAIRNLLRLIDGLPICYAIGMITVLISSQNKRLGDYLAGTVVMRESPVMQKPPAPPAAGLVSQGETSDLNVSRLSTEDFQVIDALLARCDELPRYVRLHMARRMVERLAPKLGVIASEVREPEALLRQVARSFLERARTS